MEKIKELKIFTDRRGGDLIPLHLSSLDFEAKRIFTVSNVPKNQIRGEHAHYQTRQLLICVKGEILVTLDYGDMVTETILTPGKSVLVESMVWDSQKFLTGDDFMVVVCSTEYDLSDYILSKEEFIEKKKTNQ
jgi:dTDP-4-dehydrorhamnose 3,5-epimerase-like enzyme